ncbi:MAG: carbamoyltransferase HypF [Phycisphaerae bacterium]|nr:carbamoyltransferase HypF [Phycisphaerae bacterium]
MRHRLDIRGQIQGVGFRPYVYRLACEYDLAGFVANNSNGVVIEIEGPAGSVSAFEAALMTHLPPLARITELVRTARPVVASTAAQHVHASNANHAGAAFFIEPSEFSAERRPEVTPDAALCADCLRELLTPGDRRYRYPFINCTNCGPRYSIIIDTPYDRPRTTMADFTMCDACAREYHDPRDRRFHAQPNACAKCGPQLRLCRPDRSAIEGDPIELAAGMLGAGAIVAIKGIGGFHLACDATNEDAVVRLRRLKLRDGKPLAVMVPDIEAARRLCVLDAAAEAELLSPAAPIVLVDRRSSTPDGGGLAAAVAPGCRTYGVMLPYAPVHHLLFAAGCRPLVMTSANLADQPLTYEDDAAFGEMSGVADAFLVHDRPIHRPIDDSVVFAFRDRLVMIRRARGYAPRPVRLECAATASVLAVGAELKATACLLRGRDAILSEHLGDLKRPETYRNYVRAVEALLKLFDFRPECVAHDLHPHMLSTQFARSLGLPAFAVQHHHAHIVSVLAEHNVQQPVIGICCDGVGYGTDKAAWGCEILRADVTGFERVGHLEYFPLIGGDAAARQTWRPALALWRQAHCDDWRRRLPRAFEAVDAGAIETTARQAEAERGCVATSSLGRVFDAAAFLLGLCRENRHEAEAAMAVEAAAGGISAEAYPYCTTFAGRIVRMSLAPTIECMVHDVAAGADVGAIAARFHETVARMLAATAMMACETNKLSTVAISGGCFANRRLLGRLVELLERRRLKVLFNRAVPIGDGGVSLGQAVAAEAMFRCE